MIDPYKLIVIDDIDDFAETELSNDELEELPFDDPPLSEDQCPRCEGEIKDGICVDCGYEAEFLYDEIY